MINMDLTMTNYALAEQKDLKGLAITQADIDQALQTYDEATIQTVQEIQRDYRIQDELIKGIKAEFNQGKIKMDPGTQYYSESPKTVSLRASIIRVCKALDIDARFVNYANHGRYELPIDMGPKTINELHDDDAYDIALKSNQDASIERQLRVMHMAQLKHRDTHDDFYIRYNEVKTFQQDKHIVLSNDIFNNKPVTPEDLNNIYRAYQTVKTKYDEIAEIADLSIQNNDKTVTL